MLEKDIINYNYNFEENNILNILVSKYNHNFDN